MSYVNFKWRFDRVWTVKPKSENIENGINENEEKIYFYLCENH